MCPWQSSSSTNDHNPFSDERHEKEIIIYLIFGPRGWERKEGRKKERGERVPTMNEIPYGGID